MQTANTTEWKDSGRSAPSVRGFESEEPERIHLCTTCRHAPRCMYLAQAVRPALFCEEFSVQAAPPARYPETAFGSHDVMSNENAAKGLCSDCERMDACIFLSPGGVWHCEEYL